MKFLLLFLVVALAYATPIEKRFTCELGTVNIMGSSIGTAGCLAHCAAYRYSGGYCDSHNVCHCRHKIG